MKKIMFCGGGSAGHVIPNIALCDDLRSRFDVCYLGTDGIEKDICHKNGVEFHRFSAVKLVRGKIFCNLLIPFKLAKSIKEAKAILKDTKPDILFCKGGYVCVAPSIAAHSVGIPVITHESDITPGLANKLISRYCSRVLTAFPSTARKFKAGVYVGTPMRSGLFGQSKIRAREHFGLDMRPTLIVFGGGSGSEIINRTLRKIISELCKDYNVLHICGKGNLADSNIYGYKQFEFINDMGLAYACADAAVARCGANSAAELTALKIPTLFIPLQNKRSRGDQIKNAEYYNSLHACRVLSEKNLNEASLKAEIYLLMKDTSIKENLIKLDFKCGNARIERQIEKVLNFI